MTNKETAELLCAFRICVAPTLSEAMSVAISALKAQEQLANNSPELDNNIGDLIRRQEAIEAVIKRDANCGIDSAEVLRSLPSAQPKHDISKANFLCPICGAEMEVAVSEWEEKDE